MLLEANFRFRLCSVNAPSPPLSRFLAAPRVDLSLCLFSTPHPLLPSPATLLLLGQASAFVYFQYRTYPFPSLLLIFFNPAAMLSLL
jgi:hypothetical protein